MCMVVLLAYISVQYLQGQGASDPLGLYLQDLITYQVVYGTEPYLLSVHNLLH